jgi:hypothetical protein
MIEYKDGNDKLWSNELPDYAKDFKDDESEPMTTEDFIRFRDEMDFVILNDISSRLGLLSGKILILGN